MSSWLKLCLDQTLIIRHSSSEITMKVTTCLQGQIITSWTLPLPSYSWTLPYILCKTYYANQHLDWNHKTNKRKRNKVEPQMLNSITITDLSPEPLLGKNGYELHFLCGKSIAWQCFITAVFNLITNNMNIISCIIYIQIIDINHFIYL